MIEQATMEFGTISIINSPLLAFYSLLVLWIGLHSIYQLYFHPLSRFPGPKLAALTSAWAVYNRKTLIPRVKQLHKVHKSTVIRTGPNELHFGDAHHFHQIYRFQEKFHKDPVFYSRIGVPGSLISTIPTEEHRALRALLSPYFSSRAIDSRMEKILQKCDAACSHLGLKCESGEAVDVRDLASRVTWDVISLMAFGDDPELCKKIDGPAPMLRELYLFLNSVPFLRNIPGLTQLLPRVPTEVIGGMFAGYASFSKRSNRLVMEAAHRFESVGSVSQEEHTAIFDGIIDDHVQKSGDTNLDINRLPVRQMTDQAFLLLAAGTETTATTITFLIFHLAKNRHYEDQLIQALKEIGDPLDPAYDFQKASQLPLLNQIIKEGLRLASPTPIAFPRVTPPQGAQIGDHYVEGGIKVGSSITMLHDDPEIFPNPDQFLPERWAGEEGTKLAKQLVPFQEGSRRCIAMNLANTEISMLLIKVLPRLRLELPRSDYELHYHDTATRVLDEPLMMTVSPRTNEGIFT